MKLLIIVCAALVVVALPATAVPGALDSSFGDDGVVTTAITPGPAEANALAIQADGKIVTAGADNLLEGSRQKSRFALARYNTDGSLDPTFGGDGVVRTNFTPQKDHAFGVAIQADGKIVATGEAGDGPGANTMFAAARYNPDGTLDPTFGQGGKVTTDFTPMGDFGQAVAIQADGKIVEDGLSFGVNGNATFALVRYNTDGTLDTTFGGDGRVTVDFTPLSDFSFHVAIQSDGKIVAAGVSGFGAGFADVNSTFALARFNSDGTLDATFGADGKVTVDMSRFQDWGSDVAIEADGKIVQAGVSGLGGPNSKFAIARYNVDGTLDTTFGSDGKITTDFTPGFDWGKGVAVQADGKIVEVGSAGFAGGSGHGAFALVRYNADGTLDDSFGVGGMVTTNISRFEAVASAVVIGARGNIVVAGVAGIGGNFAKVALARYLPA